jgi:hypothetical protein
VFATSSKASLRPDVAATTMSRSFLLPIGFVRDGRSRPGRRRDVGGRSADGAAEERSFQTAGSVEAGCFRVGQALSGWCLLELLHALRELVELPVAHVIPIGDDRAGPVQALTSRRAVAAGDVEPRVPEVSFCYEAL